MARKVISNGGLRKIGIKDIDSIDEKKGTLGMLDLMKKGLRL